MHIESHGDGPSIALVHGWAMHGGLFMPLVERLCGRYTLHLVDLPGHGRSRDSDMPLDPAALAPVLVDRLIGPRIAVNGGLKRRLPPRPLGQPVGRRRLPQAPFPFRPSLHPRCLAALL